MTEKGIPLMKDGGIWTREMHVIYNPATREVEKVTAMPFKKKRENMITKLFCTFLIGLFTGLYFSNTRIAEEVSIFGAISYGVLLISVLGLIVTSLVWVWK
jgi:hypothetical protein